MTKKNMDDVKQLIDIGKEKGYLTFYEVNDILSCTTAYSAASPNNVFTIQSLSTTNNSNFKPNYEGIVIDNDDVCDQQKQPVSPDSVWVPQGRTVEKDEYSISGGMLYFGKGLKTVDGWKKEPALINLSLFIDWSNPDYTCNMRHWPNYSQIHSTSRAAYLEWLSTGRENPIVDISYVFIYFYGLERRALADVRDSISARNDVPTIFAEVNRLLSIYWKNDCFRGYASRFLNVMQVLHATVPLYRTTLQIEACTLEVPLTLKVALSQMAMDNIPLTAEWALAWAGNDPSMSRSMSDQNCTEEFEELFRVRYNDKYGEGLKLKHVNARLQAIYHPASSSFGGNIGIPIPNLPNLTNFSETSSKIRDIVSACTDELEGYSRYLARNSEVSNSIKAMLFLPQPLLKKHIEKEFQNLTNWLGEKNFSDSPVLVSLRSLLQQIPSINRDRFGKKEAMDIANFLGTMNIGIEPDPHFGNFIPKLRQDVVLFKIAKNAQSIPSTGYSTATIVLHLASAVADGAVDTNEERHLEEYLETWMHLSSNEKTRLRAHTLWLQSSLPGLNGVKKRIELLKQDQQESLRRFLVGVAQVNGYIDSAKMKIHSKIYNILGLNTRGLYIHAPAAAIEPVTIQTADSAKRRGFAIPAPPKPVENFTLDMDSIEAKLAETKTVSAILNNIFSEEVPAPTSSPITTGAYIVGLDPESFTFMQALASKRIWTRDELEKLAADHSLMLDGTLDSINDASFDHFGGPFFEGDDPIEINAIYAKELFA